MKISVVIPAYNASSTIEFCLQSVLRQTLFADEIIVIDDGSSDNTASVARAISSRVTVITQANQGSAGARQHGTELATSEYIAYLDADDWWPIDHLAVCGEIVTAEPVDFLLSDFQRARQGASEAEYTQKNSTFYPWFKQYLRDHGRKTRIKNLFCFEQADGLRLFLNGYPVYPSTLLVSKKAMQETGPWDTRFKRCQDFDIGLRLAKKYKLHYLDESQAILGLHQVNSDAIAYVLMQTLGDVNVLECHLSEHSTDQHYVSAIRKALSSKYFVLGKSYNRLGNRKKALRAYVSALSFPGRRSRAMLGLMKLLFSVGQPRG